MAPPARGGGPAGGQREDVRRAGLRWVRALVAPVRATAVGRGGPAGGQREDFETCRTLMGQGPSSTCESHSWGERWTCRQARWAQETCAVLGSRACLAPGRAGGALGGSPTGRQQRLLYSRVPKDQVGNIRQPVRDPEMPQSPGDLACLLCLREALLSCGCTAAAQQSVREQ